MFSIKTEANSRPWVAPNLPWLPLRKTRKLTIFTNRSSKGPATEWEHVSITQPITTEPEPEFRTTASQSPPPPRSHPLVLTPTHFWWVQTGCWRGRASLGSPTPVLSGTIKLSQWREDSCFRGQRSEGDGVMMQCSFCCASSLAVALELACVLGVWTGFTGETERTHWAACRMHWDQLLELE